MNLSIAAKFGLPALALVAALAACTPPEVVETTPPTISSVSPTGSVVDKTTSKISVTFSEEMDSSITANVIKFIAPIPAPAISAAAWSNGNKTYSVTIGALAAAKKYDFQVATVVKDKAGNALAAAGNYSFTTKADTVPGSTVTNAVLEASGTLFDDVNGAAAVVGPPAKAATAPGKSFIDSSVTDVNPQLQRFRMGTGTDGTARGALRFSIPASIPATATVSDAKLTLTYFSQEKTPFTVLNAAPDGLFLEGADFGPALDGSSDFGSVAAPATGKTSVATAYGADNATVTVDVTGLVVAKVGAAGTRNVDLRLRFPKNFDGAFTGAAANYGDDAFITGNTNKSNSIRIYAKGVTTKQPVLVITYK